MTTTFSLVVIVAKLHKPQLDKTSHSFTHNHNTMLDGTSALLSTPFNVQYQP